MSFSNLHQHSDYSVHDGFVKIPELVSRAKELGYPALALTDHGTVTGLIDFYLECKKQGIKPILGCEFYFTEEITVQDTPTYHLIMLAKDVNGYKNLMRLDTYAHAHFYKKPRIGMEAIEKYHEGLICTTACIAGPLSSDNHDDIINKLRTIFNEDLYIELQPHNFPEQIEYNNTWLSNKYADIKRIITLDSHYVWEKDIKYHKLWLFLNPESPYYASDDYYLRSEDDILKCFNKYNIDARPMIANVEEIVSKCNVELDFSRQHYPIFCNDPATYVKNSIKEGYERLGISEYPNKEVYDKQIKHEFDVLQKLGYLNYFCIVGDMVKHCEETNIPIGLGRGSVVGCTIAWLMGITRLDPIKYNLVFERFANPERVTPPDVDTDVSTPQRDNLISYIKEKYGEVYQIRTASYLQDKSAVQRASMAINRQYPPDKPIITAKETTKRSKAINDVSDLPVKTKLDRQWKDIAIAFKGHIISYGCHASAVLVTPEDVCNWTAVEKQGDNMVACHDFHQLEKMGLLKLDILGLETLDIIKQTEHRAGINLDMADVPIDDESTALMLRRGDTEGCFQIESNVMTKIILRMNVTSVEDLMSVVALGRPGPLDSGMVETFLKRRNKQEPTTYDIPELEPILGDTEGVIVYQEQIMKIAQKICGYTLGEADNLRRIIGRKVIEDMKPAIEDMIKRGMKNGYSHDQMKRLTDNIVTFASYGFNHCLSGDTIIMRDPNGHKPLTIQEMYLTKNDVNWAKENGHEKLHCKYRVNGYGRALSIGGNRIKKNNIVDIFYSGKNKVYKVETESGKFVKCTGLHKIPTPSGMVYMKDLEVGDEVYVKGDKIKKAYNYRVYKNGEFTKNTPQKGEKGFQKIDSGHWAIYQKERSIAISSKSPCEACGATYDGNTRFEMHHVNGDRTNNSRDNLKWLCVSCHKKAHYRMGRKCKGDNGYELLTDKIASITYIGVEDVYDIEMASPNHTVLVNNGLVVSNSHSAAYGMTAWVTAYLKSHYPAAFMASLLDSNCKDKPKLATYIMYCMNNGIKILPPQLAHRNCYSGYDEDGAYIILGLNCIAGVGNSNIPKDSSSDFKTFMNDNLSLNKTCISNLVKAGVFDGNKPEMLQYITWAKDKRKSKGEFKYTEKPYNEQEEQSKVLGISFGNVFQDYNMDMVDNVSLFGFEILNVKGRKTKTGKPMAFVKARDNNSIHDLVVFNDSYKDLKTHKVYIIKLRKSQILDFVEANTK